MPQLVGSNCAICNERIPSELESSFCPQCEFPVHHRCMNPTEPPKEGRCPGCGTDRIAATERKSLVEKRKAAERPVVPRPKLEMEKVGEWVWEWYLSPRLYRQPRTYYLLGAFCFLLGIGYVLIPALRSDPDRVSAFDVALSGAAFAAGGLFIACGIWLARRR